MNMGLKVLTSAAVVSLLAACGGKDVKPVAECVYKDAPTVAAPNWICDRVHQGTTISAVGFSEKLAAGQSLTETIATTNARVKLAKTMGVQVNNMVKSFVENTGAGDAQTVDRVYTSVTKEITSERLVGARVYKTRTSPTGGLYVLVGMDDNSVKNAAKAAIKTSMGNDQALWQQFKAKKTQDELAAEIVNYKK